MKGLSFWAANQQFVATCGDWERVEVLVAGALDAFSAVKLTDGPIGFEGRVDILQRTLGVDEALAELVNRAVFLDLPDDELAAYLQSTSRAIVVSRDGDTVTLHAADSPGGSFDDPWERFKYRAMRQQVFVQLVHAKRLYSKGFAWSFQSLHQRENALGVCLPSEQRLECLILVGWSFVFGLGDLPAVVDFSDDIPRIDGFQMLDRTRGSNLLNTGAWTFVGVYGLCRDTVISVGSFYDDMTGETYEPHRVVTWNNHGAWSHTLTHYQSRYLWLRHGTLLTRPLYTVDDSEDDRRMLPNAHPEFWWLHLGPRTHVRLAWIAVVTSGLLIGDGPVDGC